ncbi:MAG: DEAD/DEAH box helicase, partial [Saprospiraceae bacterium]
MVTLRPYQQTAVEKIRQAYVSGCKAPLLVLPTGGGKTVIFSHIAATSSARGKRVLILVHRIELLRQTAKALQRAG